MPGGWLYILTNKRNGIFYIGVTSDLQRRAREHRDGVLDGVAKRYDLTCLVYVERFDEIEAARHREKTIKLWPYAWKANFIGTRNPGWRDLYDDLSESSTLVAT